MAQSTTLLKLIVLVLMIEIIASGPRSRVCQLSNGSRGICVNPRNCPHFKQLNTTSNDCNGRLVCCSTSTRIVTPFGNVHSTTLAPSTRPTTTRTFAPCTSLPPIVTTATPRPTIGSVARSKCAEYKHGIDGRTSITTYVFGGTESKSKQYPHMAALGYGQANNPEWLCGGSLISHQYVITAAHCLLLSTVGSLVVVRLGDLNLRSNLDDARPQNFGIAQTILHPLYHLPEQYNDIALIKLDRYVNFNDYIQPICLQTTYVLPNTDFIATGWGRTEITGQPSDTLMQVHLEYFPNSLCQKTFKEISPESLPNGIVEHSQLCAGSYFEEKDTCQGDSGGPLQIKNNGTFYLVGITSFGLACGIPNSPAVYTRVSFYIPWIEEIVWG